MMETHRLMADQFNFQPFLFCQISCSTVKSLEEENRTKSAYEVLFFANVVFLLLNNFGETTVKHLILSRISFALHIYICLHDAKNSLFVSQLVI